MLLDHDTLRNASLEDILTELESTTDELFNPMHPPSFMRFEVLRVRRQILLKELQARGITKD